MGDVVSSKGGFGSLGNQPASGIGQPASDVKNDMVHTINPKNISTVSSDGDSHSFVDITHLSVVKNNADVLISPKIPSRSSSKTKDTTPLNPLKPQPKPQTRIQITNTKTTQEPVKQGPVSKPIELGSDDYSDFSSFSDESDSTESTIESTDEDTDISTETSLLNAQKTTGNSSKSTVPLNVLADDREARGVLVSKQNEIDAAQPSTGSSKVDKTKWEKVKGMLKSAAKVVFTAKVGFAVLSALFVVGGLAAIAAAPWTGGSSVVLGVALIGVGVLFGVQAYRLHTGKIPPKGQEGTAAPKDLSKTQTPIGNAATSQTQGTSSTKPLELKKTVSEAKAFETLESANSKNLTPYRKLAFFDQFLENPSVYKDSVYKDAGIKDAVYKGVELRGIHDQIDAANNARRELISDLSKETNSKYPNFHQVFYENDNFHLGILISKMVENKHIEPKVLEYLDKPENSNLKTLVNECVVKVKAQNDLVANLNEQKESIGKEFTQALDNFVNNVKNSNLQNANSSFEFDDPNMDDLINYQEDSDASEEVTTNIQNTQDTAVPQTELSKAREEMNALKVRVGQLNNHRLDLSDEMLDKLELGRSKSLAQNFRSPTFAVVNSLNIEDKYADLNKLVIEYVKAREKVRDLEKQSPQQQI